MTSNPETDPAAAAPAAVPVGVWALARTALLEITSAETIGEPAGFIAEEGGALSLRFANTLPGYPGWLWTVSIAQVDGEVPTVLEVEALPGDGALLAPEWVPWAVRLAEYQAARAQPNSDNDDSDSDDLDVDDSLAELDDEDEDDDIDEDDLGYLGTALHSGDLDGVDIDELDEPSDDDDSDDDDFEDQDSDGSGTRAPEQGR